MKAAAATRRTTPRSRQPGQPQAPASPRFHLPDGSRSVQSPWVWRGFLFMSLIALGLCITFVSAHKSFLAIAWGAITAGWFTISMWLWRRHVLDDDATYRAGKKDSPR